MASTEILIGMADAGHVLIRPVGRRHPGLFDHQDANWIECDVGVAAGAFRGALQVDVRADDLSAFLDDVAALEDGTNGAANFTPAEGSLALAVARDAAGRLRVTGDAVDTADADNRLRFAFDIDEPSLRETRASLERVLAAYPVVGTTGA
ncbi:MAG: hypothetical protein HOQ29_18255 [Acidobacteria bacterium]|nr:hypothetical protein [Acidobacteriota bacterium]